jgi:hypothetical protein
MPFKIEFLHCCCFALGEKKEAKGLF